MTTKISLEIDNRTVHCNIKKQTEKALLLESVDTKRTAWIPKSGIQHRSTFSNGQASYEVKNWLWANRSVEQEKLMCY